jgi:hypothetical protein
MGHEIDVMASYVSVLYTTRVVMIYSGVCFDFFFERCCVSLLVFREEVPTSWQRIALLLVSC